MTTKVLHLPGLGPHAAAPPLRPPLHAQQAGQILRRQLRKLGHRRDPAGRAPHKGPGLAPAPSVLQRGLLGRSSYTPGRAGNVLAREPPARGGRLGLAVLASEPVEECELVTGEVVKASHVVVLLGAVVTLAARAARRPGRRASGRLLRRRRGGLLPLRLRRGGAAVAIACTGVRGLLLLLLRRVRLLAFLLCRLWGPGRRRVRQVFDLDGLLLQFQVLQMVSPQGLEAALPEHLPVVLAPADAGARPIAARSSGCG
mmetsp:Transcript_13827/g.43752  ORF Transcript_13827/g.43752 Transcript_13827/m.43752 type:complete len:257 (-) Transcript_13827:154-924(-)